MSSSRCVNLSGHESRAAAKDRLTLLVRPMDPQPRQGRYGDGTPITRTPDNALGTPYSVWDSPRHGLIPMTKDCMHRLIEACPLGAPGDLLIGRETYYLDGTRAEHEDLMADAGVVRYRADEPDLPVRWRSPATMPAWAARHRWTVVSVEVRRLHSLSCREHMQSELLPAAHEPISLRWDARYARCGLGWETDPWVWLGRIERAGGTT